MTAVFLILSLLVFAAGLVAWAVRMHEAWTKEAQRRQLRRHRPDLTAVPDMPEDLATPSSADPFAHLTNAPPPKPHPARHQSPHPETRP